MIYHGDVRHAHALTAAAVHGDTCTAAACSAYYYRRSTRPHFSLFTYICVLLPCCSVCCSINHEGWKSHEVTTETQGTSTVGTRRRAEQKAQTIQRFFSVHNTGTTSTTRRPYRIPGGGIGYQTAEQSRRMRCPAAPQCTA